MLTGGRGPRGAAPSPTPLVNLDQAIADLDRVAATAAPVMVNVDQAMSSLNRLMTAPEGLPPATLVEAGNFLSSRLTGRSLEQARLDIEREIAENRSQLDAAAQGLVKQGLADWGGGGEHRSLIVRGQGRLLENLEAADDLERIRMLFDDLERKQELIALLDRTRDGQGVRLFIGAENPLFSLSGSSVIVAPYMNRDQEIVGALGVIGPTRLNYARVIPLVDYTARVVGKILDGARP